MVKSKQSDDQDLMQINARLKTDRVGCSIQMRGSKLALIATLPPRPGSKRIKKCQQSVPLGIYGNANGLKRAERLARLLGIQMAEGTFRWSDWVEEKDIKADAKKALHEFQSFLGLDNHIFQERFLHFGLNKIDESKPVTQESLIRIIENTKANTRMRQATCERIGRFATFLGIELDTKPLEGTYSDRDKVPRNLPSDDRVVEIISSIKNEQWRNVFWLCATFGLRNHEAFFCQFDKIGGEKVLRVMEGKTGERFPCFPMPPHWIDKIDINNLPNIKCSHHDVYGQRTAGAWRRQTEGVDFTVYALRHAFAVRCHMAGVPTAIAAKWLGHSEELHCRTYKRWITQDLHLLAYQNAKKRLTLSE